jgi:hypothetical protein
MSSDNQDPDQESSRSETKVDTSSKSALIIWFRRQAWSDRIGAIALLSTLLGIAAGGIAETTWGHANSYVGGSANIWLFAITIAAVAGLMWWLARRYDAADPIPRHLAFLAAAVGVNIYLAISVWTVITQFMHPAASPHKIGSMVWWNISDAIPLINVNSVLDWQQPLTGYPVQIGWLFLLQRIVLILTVARVIQLLYARWVHYSKAETKTRATGSDHGGQPAGRSGNQEP